MSRSPRVVARPPTVGPRGNLAIGQPDDGMPRRAVGGRRSSGAARRHVAAPAGPPRCGRDLVVRAIRKTEAVDARLACRDPGHGLARVDLAGRARRDGVAGRGGGSARNVAAARTANPAGRDGGRHGNPAVTVGGGRARWGAWRDGAWTCAKCPDNPFGSVTAGGSTQATARGSAQAKARGQLTAKRAPPDGASPTLHRPPVARTIASPIASPSPAPLASACGAVESVEDPFACSSGGIPGPESSTVSVTRGPSTRHGHIHRATLRCVLAGVVEEDAEQPVEQSAGAFTDAPAGGAATRNVRRRVSAMAAKRSAVCAASIAHIHRLVVRRPLCGVEASQPEHVLEQPPHPFRLASTRVNAVRYQLASRSCVSAREVLASMTARASVARARRRR